LPGLFGAFLHGDEERVCAGLGDQGDSHLISAATTTTFATCSARGAGVAAATTGG
jgi:hypothetical protein